jgi:hypothetical protein
MVLFRKEAGFGTKLMNPEQERQTLYAEHRKQAWEDMQSSSDDFDKYILTLSSGALGLSLTFIKEIVPLGNAAWRYLLYSSWGCFGLCILLTIVSYQIGILAQKVQLQKLPKYYSDGDETALEKGGYWITVERLGWICCALFTAGLICTVFFCISNMEGVRMSELKKVTEARAPISFTQPRAYVTDARAPIPTTMCQENTSAPSEGIMQKSRQPVPITTPVQATQVQQTVQPNSQPAQSGSTPHTAKPDSQKP